MNVRVNIFRLGYTKADGPPKLAPGQEPPKPTQEAGFAIEADTVAQAKMAASDRLKLFGEEVRTLSHTTDGALAAVVYRKPPAVAQNGAARRLARLRVSSGA